MRQFPDVLGLDLAKAVSVLEERGLAVLVEHTRPDRGNPPDGFEKVVRQERLSEREMRLTACTVADGWRGADEKDKS